MSFLTCKMSLKKGYMEMSENFYHEILFFVLSASISHYFTSPPHSLDSHQKQKDETVYSPFVRLPSMNKTQKMQIQPSLNKTFCSTLPPPTNQQVKHSKPQNK